MRQNNKGKVFIIHCHDETNLRDLESLIRDEFSLVPVILKDIEAKENEPLIKKFERIAVECCFAIAIMTPDDLVRVSVPKVEKIRKRIFSYLKREMQPRPNVIFELGWFCGKNGRDKTLFLIKEGTHKYSDLEGADMFVFQESVTEPYIVGIIEKRLKLVGIISDNASAKIE